MNAGKTRAYYFYFFSCTSYDTQFFSLFPMNEMNERIKYGLFFFIPLTLRNLERYVQLNPLRRNLVFLIIGLLTNDYCFENNN